MAATETGGVGHHGGLVFREQIVQTGILPVADRYPKPLPTGKRIEVKDELRQGCYAVKAAVNPTEIGYVCVKPFSKTWLPHETITASGLLEFEMTDAPNKKWGASPADAPPNDFP